MCVCVCTHACGMLPLCYRICKPYLQVEYVHAYIHVHAYAYTYVHLMNMYSTCVHICVHDSGSSSLISCTVTVLYHEFPMSGEYPDAASCSTVPWDQTK